MAKQLLCAAVFVVVALCFEPAPVSAHPTDPPLRCRECCGCPTYYVPGGSAISLSEGNLREQLHLFTLKSAFGATVNFSLSYNSYNADASRTNLDTVLGFGWTHSLNILLFTEGGPDMIRMDGEGRMTAFEAQPDGTFVATPGNFETLVGNADGTFTIRQKNGTTFDFALIPDTPFDFFGNPIYRLTRTVDRNGNTTALTYINGDLTEITDAYGRRFTLTYSSNHKLRTIADPLGRMVSVTYNLDETEPVAIADPIGAHTQFEYNSSGQIVSKVDRDGRLFRYSYENGKPVAIRDELDAPVYTLTNSLDWETEAGLVRRYVPATTTLTDGRGNAWQYDYEIHGYLTRITAPDGSTSTYTYDPATLMVASATDANGNTTRYQYDDLGNRTRIIDALDDSTTFAYEPLFSQPTQMTDANGRVTRFEYDSSGNRTREIDPLGMHRDWTYDLHGNKLSETDKRGNLVRHEYDAFGNLSRTIEAAGLPEEAQTSFTYDAVGNLQTRTDANNNTTTFEYDSLDRLVRQTDALGAVTESAYDSEGNRVRSIDCNGNATSFEYDQRKRLVKTIDALGQQSTQTYDGNNNRTSITDKNGHVTRFEYDSQNRLTRTIDAQGNATVLTYDPVGNVSSETDATGQTTRFTYDALRRRVSKTDPLGCTTAFEYDRVGLPGCDECTGPTKGSNALTKQMDGNGKVTYFKYDTLDRLILEIRKQGDTSDVIGPDDAVYRSTYDANANRLTATEPNGNTMSRTYDALNRISTEVNAAGDTTRFEYDGVGNLIRKIEPTGNVIENTYDAQRRLVGSVDSVGLVAAYTYDCAGNRLSEADGNGNATQFSYDAIYRLVRVTDPLLQATVSAYDPVGNLVQVTDREGNQTLFLYDEINRRIATVDALQNTTQFQYDRVGNLTKIIDANGNATEYEYDGDHRLTRETYANGRSRSLSYDCVGDLQSRTDSAGQTTLYSHNDLHFLTQRAYPNSPADNFTYDLAGRMLTAERGGWMVTFEYDGANRVSRTTQAGREMDYVYDVPGRTRAIAYPGGRTLTEQRDYRGRLQRIDEAGLFEPIATYSYDLGDRVSERVYRNGSVASYSYNANDWIIEVAHASGGARIADFTHEHDREGNKQFSANLFDSTRSEAYQYDRIYRLADFRVGELVGSTVPVPITQTQYNLDAGGNWNSKTTDGVSESRTHDVVNEITAIDDAALRYDGNGNLIEDARFRYDYDEENRLIRATRRSDAAVVGEYRYDALGRRVVKVAGATETRYFYDDARLIEEQDSSGATRSTFVYGNNIDEVLTRSSGGRTLFYHQNALWSVVAITDESGGVLERYTYDAYGCASSSSAVGNPFFFTGRQLDDETGLYFYRARYYDCTKGRFLQRDPIEYGSGMNLYEYALGNPTRYVDPNGAQAETPLRYPLGNPANAGELSKDLSDKLINWLTDDCNIDPARPSKKSIRFEFPKCTLATDIIPSIVPSGMMKCAAGKLDKAQQKTQLGKALAAAVSIAGYFDSPESYGLSRDGEYCGYIEVTKEFNFKHSEKPPIIISRAFSLTFDIQLRGCNTDDVRKKFRLDLLKWTEEFKDEPVKIGDGVPPPNPPRPPVGTK